MPQIQAIKGEAPKIMKDVSEILQLLENTGLLMAICLYHQTHYSITPSFHYSNCERSELTCTPSLCSGDLGLKCYHKSIFDDN